ncbi:response regulator [Flavobacteriaceae bacterium W22]|nr:response regulator [Flavobacteriaceae bacterium W22]
MKILIIEDEEKLLQLLKDGLAEEGHQIDTAKDGNSGLIKAVNQKFDLILLDWMLPELSGLEVCLRIRKNDSNTPILFLTSRDSLEDVILGLETGANDYIKKPFRFEELIARINVYARNIDREDREYSLGDIKILTEKFQVLRNNKEIPLTQTEYDLLKYLVKNKGTVQSRPDILHHVWGINYQYDAGVIDVFINGIRKKLGITPSDERIKAVRGRGFIAKD